MIKFFKRLFWGGGFLVILAVTPPFENYQAGSYKSILAFFQFFRKKDDDLKIKITVPPPPPPPGFETSNSSEPLRISPPEIPNRVPNLTESGSHRSTGSEPSPWQWF